jgi:hypothetical protein
MIPHCIKEHLETNVSASFILELTPEGWLAVVHNLGDNAAAYEGYGSSPEMAIADLAMEMLA